MDQPFLLGVQGMPGELIQRVIQVTGQLPVTVLQLSGVMLGGITRPLSSSETLLQIRGPLMRHDQPLPQA